MEIIPILEVIIDQRYVLKSEFTVFKIPILHLVPPQKINYISIVFSFSWDCMHPKRGENNYYVKIGRGWGVNKVYYGKGKFDWGFSF